jgi:transcription initiation factor IIE alpha subunit
MSIADDSVQGTPASSDEYDEMIEVLDEIIEMGLSKLTGDGRIKDTDKAKARAEYMKRTEQAIRAKRQVVKDQHLQEMGRTLEALKEGGDLDV